MIVLLISIAALGLTIYLYIRNLKFAPLRILSIILLYVLITGFVFSLKMKKKSTSPVLLVDYSASMANYFSTVAPIIKKIEFPHSLVFFSESLYSQVLDDSVPFGKYTNIADALLKVSKLQPSAIVLISDGNHNFGHTPLADIENLDIPIYCFGVGAAPHRDVAIVDVSYPEYAYIGDSVQIEVTVQSQQFEGGRGIIKLKPAKKNKPQSKSFPLSSIKAKNSISFWVYTSQLGEEKNLIQITPQPGEETYDNNEFEFSLKILEKKIKVLYYTEHLSFNAKFIMQILTQDNYIDFQPLVKVKDNRYLRLGGRQSQPTKSELGTYDVLILDNINLRTLPWNNLKDLLQKGLGILCLGKITGHTDEWRDILPVNTADLPIKGNHIIKIIEPFSCLVPGDDYPPLSYINRVVGIKENAVIVAEANHMPIIAYRSYGRGMVFQINVLDIGTWQFLQMGLKQKDVLSYLITDIVRFVSMAGKNRRLVLQSLNKDYLVGQTIELTLQSYDRDFKFAGGGDFYGEFEGKKIPFFEVKRGIYKSSLIAEESGTFHVKAFGRLNEEMLSSNELEIRIKEGTIETARGLNQEYLQTLSAKTSGKYYSINELSTFTYMKPKESYVVKKLGFDSPFSYFLIVCLLAIDWFLRRRQGII